MLTCIFFIVCQSSQLMVSPVATFFQETLKIRQMIWKKLVYKADPRNELEMNVEKFDYEYWLVGKIWQSFTWGLARNWKCSCQVEVEEEMFCTIEKWQRCDETGKWATMNLSLLVTNQDRKMEKTILMAWTIKTLPKISCLLHMHYAVFTAYIV